MGPEMFVVFLYLHDAEQHEISTDDRHRRSNRSSAMMFGYVSEWLLFNDSSAIVQLYLGENKLILNEMMLRF